MRDGDSRLVSGAQAVHDQIGIIKDTMLVNLESCLINNRECNKHYNVIKKKKAEALWSDFVTQESSKGIITCIMYITRSARFY